MSKKTKACPECNDRPRPFKRWHDKHNRVFNHLRWGVRCKGGHIESMGGYRQEAVTLYNDAVDFRIERMQVIDPTFEPRRSWREIFSLIWHGLRGPA